MAHRKKVFWLISVAVAFVSGHRKEVQQGEKMQIEIPLPFAKGNVYRRVFLDVKSCVKSEKNLFEIRGEFENLSEQSRETIIRFIFEEQRRRMKKE